MKLLIVTFLGLTTGALGYPSGAPNQACDFMMPSHGAGPQKSDPPYTITSSKDCYNANEKMTVTISSDPSAFFIGFLIKSVDLGGSNIVGTFIPTADGLTQNRCRGKGLTHTTNTVMHTQLILEWTAPAAGTGTVKFLATLVRQKLIFWGAEELATLPECPQMPQCENLLSPENTITVKKDGEKDVVVSSCSDLVDCYPGLCSDLGKPGGSCCKKCKSVGTPDCLDKASECSPISVTINGEQTDITSCKQLKQSAFKKLCSPDALGSDSCCKFCKGKCVDSLGWQLKKSACMDCTCAQLSGSKLKKCCKKNWKGIGSDGKRYGCREACCKKCTKKGFPPN